MTTENVRQQNEGIIDWLRRLSSRVDCLEKGDKGVRINDTRLGDLVLRPNRDTNQIEATNLATGDMTPISGVREAVWSWPGELIMSELEEGNNSPPYVMADTTVANEIVLGRSAGTTWVVCVAVHFPNGLTILTALDPGSYVNIKNINVRLNRNDLVYVELIGVNDTSDFSEGSPMNVSVSVRFGEPSTTADNRGLLVVGSGYEGVYCGLPA